MSGARGVALGTLTFPLAYVWHLVVFADLYRRIRFVTVPEPNVALGFFTIVFQGVLLAAFYPRFLRHASAVRDGLGFGLAVGAFIWSSAALAHVAKHDVVEPATFIGMEAAYFLINFVAYGLVIGWLHRRRATAAAQQPYGKHGGQGPIGFLDRPAPPCAFGSLPKSAPRSDASIAPCGSGPRSPPRVRPRSAAPSGLERRRMERAICHCKPRRFALV